jgi:hypothetical protein
MKFFYLRYDQFFAACNELGGCRFEPFCFCLERRFRRFHYDDFSYSELTTWRPILTRVVWIATWAIYGTSTIDTVRFLSQLTVDSHTIQPLHL